MRIAHAVRRIPQALLALALALAPAANAANWTVIGWNDLGMHCMDADYSVFAILPPFNTIHAQVIGPDGKLVAGAVGVGYRATNDATGSITTSSIGRTGFWATCPQIFGAAPAPDQGLAGFLMPGPLNVEQAMPYGADMRLLVNEGTTNWQSDWTVVMYLLLAATLWRARAAQIPE